MARTLDDKIGLVLAALDETGLRENTLVIYTTDHGLAFPDMKCSLTDHGIGVALIMQGPAPFSGGRAIDAMVSHIDIFPTLCDLLDIDPPAWLQGHSMLPLLRGEADSIRAEIFAEVSYHAAYEPKRAVRSERHKYIRRYDQRESPVLSNIDDGLAKSAWIDAGYAERAPAPEQLYDTMLDPNERLNLVDDPAQAATLADMRARLDRWMRDTDDPLLRGHIPAPPGAELNDPDGLSPPIPSLSFLSSSVRQWWQTSVTGPNWFATSCRALVHADDGWRPIEGRVSFCLSSNRRQVLAVFLPDLV